MSTYNGPMKTGIPFFKRNIPRAPLFLILSILVHAGLLLGLGDFPGETGIDTRRGPLRVGRISLGEGPQDAETAEPDPSMRPVQESRTETPEEARSALSRERGPGDAPAFEAEQENAPGERISRALSGWDPETGTDAAGGGTAPPVEGGESGGINGPGGTAVRVPFGELTGIDLVLPKYPEMARRWGWEGIAAVRITVAADGRVVNAELLESSGYDALDRAALKVVTESWSFEPPGRPVTTIKEFDFVLEER